MTMGEIVVTVKNENRLHWPLYDPYEPFMSQLRGLNIARFLPSLVITYLTLYPSTSYNYLLISLTLV